MTGEAEISGERQIGQDELPEESAKVAGHTRNWQIMPVVAVTRPREAARSCCGRKVCAGRNNRSICDVSQSPLFLLVDIDSQVVYPMIFGNKPVAAASLGHETPTLMGRVSSVAKISKTRSTKKSTTAKKATTVKKAKAAPTNLEAAEQEVTVTRRTKSDRRATDRRQQQEPVAGERRKLERREKVSRRRQIDPTTCERDYTSDEIEFMAALDQYKRTSGRMFPTCSEILEVFKGLGYQKVTPTEQVAEPVGEQMAEPAIEPLQLDTPADHVMPTTEML